MIFRTFKIGMPVGLVETSVMIAKSVSVKQAIKTAKRLHHGSHQLSVKYWARTRTD
ncbi:hypothetical protein CF65_01863 [Aggregatibacter actinomycetemcomitans HK1651]|nr:hypothetical protein CF65_01863 [Aggregatibacter actinomycetemcomitans HK1651]